MAITAYMAVRIVTALTRALVSPDHASLRMVHLNDQAAAYALRWVRRLAAVVGFGYAATQIGLQYGLPPAARDAFLKAVALIDHIFLVIIILQIRARVARRIRSHAERLTVTGRVRNRLASVWHLIAIFFVIALWLVWAAQVHNGYARLWHVFVVTVGVLIAARLIGIVLLGGLERALRVSPELAHRYPGLEARANRYYPILRAVVNTLLFLTTGVALLWGWGLNTASWFHNGGLGGKLVSALITVAIAGAVTLAVWEGVNTGLDRHLARLTREAQISRGARLRTLMPILRTILMVVLVATFGLTALSEIGVNIAPLLAGRRHHRRGDRLRLAKAGAGFHHRHLPAAGKRHAGGRCRDRGRAVRLGREPVHPHHAPARGRRIGAHHPVQLGHHGHQRQSRHRQCRRVPLPCRWRRTAIMSALC